MDLVGQLTLNILGREVIPRSVSEELEKKGAADSRIAQLLSRSWVDCWSSSLLGRPGGKA